MSFTRLFALLTALCSVVFLALPAQAGSLAQTINPAILRLGPGAEYPVISDLPEKIAVDVERCMERWCLLQSKSSAERGWTSIENLTFGEEPRGKLTGPKDEQVSYGSGTICFYTGEHFTGQSVCSTTGTVMPDLALNGLDNTFESVSVHGTISALVCREFHFGSWCETIAEDKPVLSRFLYNAVSSYRVW